MSHSCQRDPRSGGFATPRGWTASLVGGLRPLIREEPCKTNGFCSLGMSKLAHLLDSSLVGRIVFPGSGQCAGDPRGGYRIQRSRPKNAQPVHALHLDERLDYLRYRLRHDAPESTICLVRIRKRVVEILARQAAVLRRDDWSDSVIGQSMEKDQSIESSRAWRRLFSAD